MKYTDDVRQTLYWAALIGPLAIGGYIWGADALLSSGGWLVLVAITVYLLYYLSCKTTTVEDMEKARAERERLARAQAERERLAHEQAERERLARERIEAIRERFAREKAERERLARERVERERLAQEQAERERLAREQAERERLAREPQPRAFQTGFVFRHYVRSSMLSWIQYFPDKEQLELGLRRGVSYLYGRVPPSIYIDLLRAESKGRFVNSTIFGGSFEDLGSDSGDPGLPDGVRLATAMEENHWLSRFESGARHPSDLSRPHSTMAGSAYIESNTLLHVSDNPHCPRGHFLQPGAAKILVADRNHELVPVALEIGVCNECSGPMFFVPTKTWNSLRRIGVPICRTDYSGGLLDTSGWKLESDLRVLGYNVNQNENLSDETRQKILRLAIESGLYRKEQLIDFLNGRRQLASGDRSKDMSSAITRWSADIWWLRHVNIQPNGLLHSLPVFSKFDRQITSTGLYQAFCPPDAADLTPAREIGMDIINGCKIWSESKGRGIVVCLRGNSSIEVLFDAVSDCMVFDKKDLPHDMYIVVNA